MNLQQLFFAAYVQYLAPAYRTFFVFKWGMWYIVAQTVKGQAQRKQTFDTLLKAPGGPGQLDAEIMVNGADPWETYKERASVGAIFGVPPANQPGLGENPGYAFPNATPQPGQQAYPTSALPGWQPCPSEAQMSAFEASTTEGEAKTLLAKYFPAYKGVA